MNAILELRARLEKAAQGKQPVDLLDLADLLRAEQHYREALAEIARTQTATPERPELILDRVVWDARHALNLSFGQSEAALAESARLAEEAEVSRYGATSPI